MDGKIKFLSAKSLAEFLKEFTGSSAMFEVFELPNDEFELEFTGGH